MSERMIELKRARLLAAGKGPAAVVGASTESNGGIQGSRGGVNGPADTSSILRTTLSAVENGLKADSVDASTLTVMSSQDASIYAMHQEDLRVQRFLQRIQQTGASTSTVPPALSRRILHRQGVLYRDPAVANVLSGAADRFLSTVLQQAISCRDRRLKGIQLSKDAAWYRERHNLYYEQNVAERKRRRQARIEKLEERYRATIDAATVANVSVSTSLDVSNSTLTKSRDKGTNSVPTKKTYKKKKKAATAVASNNDTSSNSNKVSNPDFDNDSEEYDSLDEEEEYYQEFYGDDFHHSDSHGRRYSREDSDDDEENDMLILRDLARPLKAWDISVLGKEGMDPAAGDDNEEHVEEDDELDWDAEDEIEGNLDEGTAGTQAVAGIEAAVAGIEAVDGHKQSLTTIAQSSKDR